MKQSYLNSLPTEALLAPSAEFKKETTRSVIAIVGFILVYFILFVLSLALAGVCLFGGVAILAAKVSFLTLLLSVGIIGCGVMIFVFLVKFLFSSSKADTSDSIEITEQDQPVLFQTIYALAEETGVPKPKKIFLSHDVNAAVFYDSSFWSMFLPVKKNLKIGLGLVNILNVSELKAVIAHEFGHFSQRSMKVGSWVYQVNKIIYDMLFNNQGYAKSLQKFASVHGLVALLVHLTVKVVQGIQWVLNKMFGVVNKSYLSLSRQMEFHADLVAASVCGSNNIINALRRSEFAEVSFSSTLDTCNAAWKEKKVVTDFYIQHRIVTAQLADLQGLSLVNGLPVLNQTEESRSGNRVNYKDQWASHPTLQERKAHLDQFELTAAVDDVPAWALFQNEEEWKKKLTKVFYNNIPDEIQGTLDAPQFSRLFTEQLQAYAFPAIFREYYNNRVITAFDPVALVQKPFVLQPLANLLTDDAVGLPGKLRYLEQDIAVLQAIIKKEIITTSFDFDGQKYSRKEAPLVMAQLEGEKEALQQEVDALDQTLFRHFYSIAPLAEAEGLKDAYQRYFELRTNADDSLEKMNRMMDVVGPVFHGETMTVEEIQTMIENLKSNHEPAFKQLLNEWLFTGAFDADVKVKESVEKFLQMDYAYFAGVRFFDHELIELNSVVQDGWSCISNYIFGLFKAITERQAEIMEKKNQVVAEV
jgi:Zn-dependent protease with chaperone function